MVNQKCQGNGAHEADRLAKEGCSGQAKGGQQCEAGGMTGEGAGPPMPGIK